MKKVRYSKYTVFAFGEGETEKALLKHVRASYGRQAGIVVTVDCGNGGSPETIIDLAVKRSKCAFNRHFILLDTDRPWTDEAKNNAKKNNYELIPATPCIEGFLLSLLEPTTDVEVMNSIQCKKKFEEKYLNEDEKLDYKNYEKILPLKKLEQLRKTNPLLNSIIALMIEV